MARLAGRQLNRAGVFAVAALIPLTATAFGLYRAASLGFDSWGMDFLVYWDAVHRWAGGGPVYLPWQLAGPYESRGTGTELAVLMPPPFLLVAAPFAVLPREVAGALWVLVPPAVIGWAIYRLRPSPWSWPCSPSLRHGRPPASSLRPVIRPLA